jgi:phage regulator Rha-like protein
LKQDENSKFVKNFNEIVKILLKEFQNCQPKLEKTLAESIALQKYTVKVQLKCSKTIVNRTWPAVVAVACLKYSGRTRQKSVVEVFAVSLSKWFW